MRAGLIAWGASLGLIVIAALGLVLWVSASDGEKTSDLGSALVGGAVIGVGLVLFERAWDHAERNRVRAQATVVIAPGSEGAVDSEPKPYLTEAEAAGAEDV